MVYQDVMRFLKRTLAQPKMDCTWGVKENFSLLNYLQDRYSDEQIENNAMEIRQAFRDFFEPLGNALVRYTANVGVNFKIFPYHVDPTKSVHLKTLIDIIRENRRTIEYPYNGREDQISISGKIRRKINEQIVETEEKVNKKELIRLAIKEALQLNERDVVLHLKKKFLIKLFQKNSFLEKSTQEKEQIKETASEVIDEGALEIAYNELFKDIKISDFINQVMDVLFSSTLNFEKINNEYYEKNVLILVKKQIKQELASYISDNDEYLKQLSTYIMKENLIYIHELISIEIFEKITNKDVNARAFLNYYTGQIYVENGKRYIIPEIVTDDGKRWNINSLISTASVWLRTRSLLMKSKVQRQNIEQKIGEMMPDYSSAKQQLDAHNHEHMVYLKKFKDINQKVEEAVEKLNSEVKTAMAISKESALEMQIRQDKQALKDVRLRLNFLSSHKTEKEKLFLDISSIYNDLNREKNQSIQKIQNFERDLAIGSDSFHSILSSVVKALMKRKVEID
jgi:hypothetical protein